MNTRVVKQSGFSREVNEMAHSVRHSERLSRTKTEKVTGCRWAVTGDL